VATITRTLTLDLFLAADALNFAFFQQRATAWPAWKAACPQFHREKECHPRPAQIFPGGVPQLQVNEPFFVSEEFRFD